MDSKSHKLTPTQLRNARKRRSKKKLQRKAQNESMSTPANGKRSKSLGSKDCSDGDEALPKSRKRPRNSQSSSKRRLDPSLEYIDNPLEAPLIQQAKEFFKGKTSEFPVYLGPKYKWRTLVKLAVRPNSKGKLCIGMFAKTSHEIVPDSGTSPLHHPAINRIVQLVEQRARKYNVPAFSEMDDPRTISTSRLKYVTASLERSTQKIQLTLICQVPNKDSEEKVGDKEDACDVLCHRLWEEAGNTQLQSLWMHTHPQSFSKHNNAIYAINGGTWKTVFGPHHGAQESICPDEQSASLKSVVQSKGEKEAIAKSKFPPTLYFPPNVFRQANIDAFSKIVQEICEYLNRLRLNSTFPNNPQPSVLELYGGVGTIGLGVAWACSCTLICSDENPYNRACFERSAVFFTPDQCRYIPHNAMDVVTVPHHAKYLKQADWLVVDPPRKGLEPVVCQALCEKALHASVLIYVSCGFTAFQRDYQFLSQNGWKLDQASGHVLFPGSDAIETLAIFKRRSSAAKTF